jgi:sulfopyruvate decarboxylase alpha subunit
MGMTTERMPRRQRQPSPLLRQSSGTICPWRHPSPTIFVTSFIARQHRGGIIVKRRSWVKSGHVDNPCDPVKFRRLDETVAIMSPTTNRRRTWENSMAAAEGQISPQAFQDQAPRERSWHEIVLQTLKRNEIRLVPYVPDRVLTTLIKNIHADPFFTTFPTAREEEAVGIVSGAWMGGLRGAVLMQTSGFATLANVLASLAIPYQIPLIMFVSERGTLGEFNYGQSLVCRTMRPVLDSLAMEHHTATRLDEFEFIVDRSIKQAITTQAPVALILSPLLTGGKVFEK